MMRTRISVGLAGFCGAVLTAVLFVLPARTSGRSNLRQTKGDEAGQAVTTPAAAPKLAGTWKLNEQQSDDPREKMRAAMNANGGPGGPGGGNPGRMGRRSGRGPGRGGMMAQFSQLTIEQTDKATKVTGASGRLIATTEPAAKEDQNAQDNNGGMMMRMLPAEAKWQDNKLVATSQGFGGGTVTRTFELSPDGKQLYVTTKMENERFSQPVTYKLVYDPAKSESNSQ